MIVRSKRWAFNPLIQNLILVHLIPHTSTIQGRIKGVLHFIPGTYQHTSGSHCPVSLIVWLPLLYTVVVLQLGEIPMWCGNWQWSVSQYIFILKLHVFLFCFLFSFRVYTFTWFPFIQFSILFFSYTCSFCAH